MMLANRNGLQHDRPLMARALNICPAWQQVLQSLDRYFPFLLQCIENRMAPILLFVILDRVLDALAVDLKHVPRQDLRVLPRNAEDDLQLDIAQRAFHALVYLRQRLMRQGQVQTELAAL